MNETSASATITYKQQGTEDSATNITSTENRVEVENKTGTTLPPPVAWALPCSMWSAAA